MLHKGYAMVMMFQWDAVDIRSPAKSGDYVTAIHMQFHKKLQKVRRIDIRRTDISQYCQTRLKNRILLIRRPNNFQRGVKCLF